MKKVLVVFALMLGFSTVNFAQQKIKEKNGVVKTKNAEGKTKVDVVTGDIKKKDANGTMTKTKTDLGKITADKVKPATRTTKTKTADTKTKAVKTVPVVKKDGTPDLRYAANKKTKKEPAPAKKK